MSPQPPAPHDSWILIVASNAAYLPAFFLMYKRGEVRAMLYVLLVCVVSPMYHTCDSHGYCFDIKYNTWHYLDFLVSELLISFALINLLQLPPKILPYPEVASLFFIILANLEGIDAVWVFIVIAAQSVVMFAIKVYFDRMKYLRQINPIHFTFGCIAMLLGGCCFIFFQAELYYIFHSLWHTFTGIAAFNILAAIEPKRKRSKKRTTSDAYTDPDNISDVDLEGGSLNGADSNSSVKSLTAATLPNGFTESERRVMLIRWNNRMLQLPWKFSSQGPKSDSIQVPLMSDDRLSVKSPSNSSSVASCQSGVQMMKSSCTDKGQFGDVDTHSHHSTSPASSTTSKHRHHPQRKEKEKAPMAASGRGSAPTSNATTPCSSSSSHVSKLHSIEGTDETPCIYVGSPDSSEKDGMETPNFGYTPPHMSEVLACALDTDVVTSDEESRGHVPATTVHAETPFELRKCLSEPEYADIAVEVTM
eukprot:GFYU01003677.1.p1 GENE.GFYU01003677.1~~GFYU01003677.1.p1  ORF type:complete len:476 (+),score=76.29 GFYU01003677.1:319-1746(+)